MKTVSNNYKEEIKKLGREIDFKFYLHTNSKIITENSNFLFTEDNRQLIVEQFNEEEVQEIISQEDIYNVSIVKKGKLLSTFMEEIDFEIKQDLRIGDTFDAKFGLKVNGNYEYVDYGRFMIYSKEFNEDTKTYSYVAFDSMLLSMIEVDDRNIIENVRVKTAIKNICSKVGLGIEITDEDEQKFPNLNNKIAANTFKDLQITYRDVLDYICQCLGVSMVSNNKILYLKLPSEGNIETDEIEGIDFKIDNNKGYKITDTTIYGDTTQEENPTPDTPKDIETVTGRNEIKVTGKNLFNKDNPNVINGYVNYNTGIFTSASASNQKCFYIKIEPNTTYTWSNYVSNAAVGYGLYSNIPSINDTASTYGQIIQQKTITTGTNDNYLVMLYSSITATINLSQFQLEKNNQFTEYEPYVNQNYEINLGKNLFDKDNADIQLGSINDSGAATTNNHNFRTTTFIKVNPNTKYTISVNTNIDTLRLHEYTGTQSFIKRTVLNNTNVLTITTSNSTNYLTWSLNYDDSTTFTIETAKIMLNTLNLQIERSSEASEYAPYFTPIELCKIGDYQDYIAQSTGKNIFDGETEIGYFDNNTGEKLSGGGNMRNKNIISVMPNTTYIISNNNAGASMNVLQYNNNNEFITANLVTANNSFTTSNETYYINFWRANNLSSISIQIEKNTQITDYEPYGVGVWYKHKEIGKIIYDGSESWSFTYSASNGMQAVTPLTTKGVSGYGICNVAGYSGTQSENFFYVQSTGINAVFRKLYINGSQINTTAKWNSFVSSNYIELYYVLATPTAEIITNETLIAQLNALNDINLFEGINNIIDDTSNLYPYLKFKMSYIHYETLTAEYLKDKNVTFGKKYGPINSVVLSRSEDNDTIYRKDDESIALNGLTEFKIKDNLIMLGDDRESYIDEIFNQLNGLEYYVNDYASTGITYLDILDKYNVEIEDKIYPCLLLNDEIKIRQGLEEKIYTEEPEETTTNYKTSSKTDKEVSFIVDKQNGEIKSRVTQDEMESAITQTAEQLQVQITDNTGNISTLQQTAGSLQSQITDNTGSISTLTQTTNSISQTVENNNTKANIVAKINDNTSQVKIDADNVDLEANDVLNILSGNTINLTSKNIAINSTNFSVDKNGNLTSNSGTFNNVAITDGYINLKPGTGSSFITMTSGDNKEITYLNPGGINTTYKDSNKAILYSTVGNGVDEGDFLSLENSCMYSNNDTIEKYNARFSPDTIGCWKYNTSGSSTSRSYMSSTEVRSPSIINESREEIKKNFEKFENGLDIIKNIDIYKYNYKHEEDGDKKHIGVVIGKNYKYSKEITSNEDEGIDIYSFVAVCCKAIQEQQEEINELKEEIKSLKESEK